MSEESESSLAGFEMASPINSNSRSFRKLNPHLYPEEVMTSGTEKIQADCNRENRGDSACASASVASGERASESNTRQFTNLVLTKSTDEEKLNKLERDWLRQLRLTHPEQNIGIQSITLKLANDTRYTPDFWTIDPNGQLMFWECKGFFRDDAKVKIKVAARQFLHFRFILVRKEKGQWTEERVFP
jgi:hypothetical protein